MNSFEPLDPQYVADPWPTLGWLREHEPVHRAPGGAWVLTRYQDIVAALADRRLGNAPSPYATVNVRNRERYVCADVATNILPFLDAPEHTEPRKLIARTFQQQLNEFPPDMAGRADSLLQSLAGNPEIELMEAFATPWSVAVISELLGFPEEDWGRLKAWSESFFYLFSIIPSREVLEQLNAGLAEFREYLQQLLAQRRTSPGHDLISRLVSVSDSESGMSDLALVDNLMLLFADGVENVDSMIANAMAVLLQHPLELDKLRDNPALIPAAAEECLRFETPAQFIGRTALEDLTIGGVEIKRSSGVLLVIAAANRDPDFVDNPDRLDISRPAFTQLSFGKGRHACIGGPLVKQQLEIALTALLRAFPSIALVEEPLDWQPRLAHRWLRSLRLAVS